MLNKDNQLLQKTTGIENPKTDWQSWGQGFDPPQLHQNKQRLVNFDRPFLFL
jgi:hypothetical protein